MRLHELVAESAQRHPHRLAVQDGDRALSYAELDRLADDYAAGLVARGVRPGDRVLLWCAKSALAVALTQGCLRAGAVYVPVSPANPVPRLGLVADGCAAALIVTDDRGAQRTEAPHWTGAPLVTLAELMDHAEAGARFTPVPGRPEDLAYVLYTSGSTGEPKGVCLSHRNALSFVSWAVAELGLTPADRLSNHAPLNFDLSVFDIYGAFLAGASVHLVTEEMGYTPQQLAQFIRDRQITVWYSVPSALMLMMEHADMLTDPPAQLRVCVFAGEPFPGPRARELGRAWPGVRLFNWYGPTETNVCMSYELVGADLTGEGPIPIGKPCSGDGVELQPVGDGETELVVTGPTVMMGYWSQPPAGDTYRTGDIVRQRPDGNVEFVGRRDQLVKVRGHRVELGEIEAVLAGDPDVAEVVALVLGDGLDARLHAVVRPSSEHVPSLLQLKRRCAERLPTYMVIDAVHVLAALPRTPNGKKDRRQLAQQIAADPSNSAASSN